MPQAITKIVAYETRAVFSFQRGACFTGSATNENIVTQPKRNVKTYLITFLVNQRLDRYQSANMLPLVAINVPKLESREYTILKLKCSRNSDALILAIDHQSHICNCDDALRVHNVSMKTHANSVSMHTSVLFVVTTDVVCRTGTDQDADLVVKEHYHVLTL